eukprot:2435340-Prymnesium_polylepis.2
MFSEVRSPLSIPRPPPAESGRGKALSALVLYALLLLRLRLQAPLYYTDLFAICGCGIWRDMAGYGGYSEIQ